MTSAQTASELTTNSLPAHALTSLRSEPMEETPASTRAVHRTDSEASGARKGAHTE